MLTVILTFATRQHILKWNVSVNKSSPVGIYFVKARLENKYFFENPRVRELTSQKSDELIHLSPTVSAAQEFL